MINKIKNDKVLLILTVLIVAVAILLVSRVAYAFLTMSVNDVTSRVHLDSDEVDQLKFKVGSPLSLDITSSSLPKNGEAVTVTSTSEVSLKANETDNRASYTYYVYLDIPENTFNYTTAENKPEILLKVMGPNGEVTSLTGLNYVTENGISGFDITTKTGLIEIAANEPISSTSSTAETIHTWTLSLSYLNFESEQSSNYGSHLKTSIGLTKNQVTR